ncbi:DUF3696 domain-containing protein [Cytophagaceae bacterium ABcell3]|nr:DUF3696 domain-containing protein [Cytophagaceae bacterium ABcell3]
MLTNLKINNFKALRIADLKLGSINLFSGLNAVGKSSVIQSLLLLRQSFEGGGFPKGLILKNEDYVNLGLGKDVCSIGASAEERIFFELEFNYENTVNVEFNQAPNRDILPLLNFGSCVSSNFNIDEVALFTKDFQYLSANRIKPQIQYVTSPYHVDDLKSLGKEGEYTVHFLAKNKDRPISNKELVHSKAKSDTLLDNVNAWISDISPGVKVNATYHEELETASLGYSFEIASGYTQNFKPTNVGFGLTYILPIIVGILILPPKGLILIENPESHLHPGGQSKIAQLCAIAANSGVQVILESHSDHILNGLRVAVKQNTLEHDNVHVYYFHREANSEEHETRITEINIDRYGRADEWPKGFFDEWDNQLDILLS